MVADWSFGGMGLGYRTLRDGTLWDEVWGNGTLGMA